MLLGILLFICICLASDLKLAEPLEVLRPLVNKQWVGGFVDPVSRKTYENIQRFEAIWGGTAIKYTYSVSDTNTFAEGFFIGIVKLNTSKPLFFIVTRLCKEGS